MFLLCLCGKKNICQVRNHFGKVPETLIFTMHALPPASLHVQPKPQPFNMTNSIRLYASCILLLFASAAYSQSTYNNDVKQAAITLYNSFSTMQKRASGLNFEDTSRLKWNNLPVGLRARVGTSIGNMSDDQRKLLHRVLSVSLSSQGYLKATSIMHLDDLLNRYYDSLFYKKEINDSLYGFMRSLLWAHKNYFFAFFGQPTDANWG